MPAALAPVPASGSYLTNGKRLVLVLGPAFEGGVEVENAMTEQVYTLRTEALAFWWAVIPSPA